MGRTGWDRFDKQDDGYYTEPLTLRADTDSGAIQHLARKREREHVVAYLRSKAWAVFEGTGNSVLALADEIERGEHYASPEEPPPGYGAINHAP